MTIFHALILGIIQGLTEFLPVSSSGHLVLAEHFLKIELDPAALQSLNVLLHAGTLCALLLVYWKNWFNLLRSPFNKDRANQKLLFYLVLVSLPAAGAGLLFQDVISRHFSQPNLVAAMLFITGISLLIGERAAQQRGLGDLKVADVVLIGVAQALALLPGISRSGVTVAAARLRGLERREALDFSFIMAVPVIGGATLLTAHQVLSGAVTLPESTTLLVAFGVCTALSLWAIFFLRKFVAKRSLAWFAPYLFAASVSLMISELFA